MLRPAVAKQSRCKALDAKNASRPQGERRRQGKTKRVGGKKREKRIPIPAGAKPSKRRQKRRTKAKRNAMSTIKHIMRRKR